MSAFIQFKKFPNDIKDMIWGFTVSLSPPTPEVCIAWPLIMQTRDERGLGEPHLPMTVDTAWPAVAHVCHGSREALFRGIKQGRLPVTLRYSSQADMLVPYRLFQPEIDTLYWTDEQHCWITSSFLDDVRRNDFPEARHIRHIALGICQTVEEPIFWCIYRVIRAAPGLRTLTFVVPGTTRGYYSQKGLTFAPPARRCRLRILERETWEGIQICQYQFPRRYLRSVDEAHREAMTLRDADGRAVRKIWWDLGEHMYYWIRDIVICADEDGDPKPVLEYKFAVFEEWEFKNPSEPTRSMPSWTAVNHEQKHGRWVEVCEDRRVGNEGLRHRTGPYIPVQDRKDPRTFRLLDYDCARFWEFSEERQRRRAEQETPEAILGTCRPGWLFGEEEML